MIENFIEYMWYLLHTPLKKLKKALNKWYIFCRVFGKRFDEAKEDILRARDEGMVATCSYEMLPVHGADRRLTRYEGEHPENFRSRIAMYEEICKLGGTNEGVLLAVRTLGYNNPVIVSAKELYGDADRWAEFYIIIVMDTDEEHPISFGLLKKTVRQWKEVGAKDNYYMKYHTAIKQPHTVIFPRVEYKKFIYFYDYLKLDGKWQLDGTHIMDAVVHQYPTCVGYLYKSFYAGLEVELCRVSYRYAHQLMTSTKMSVAFRLFADYFYYLKLDGEWQTDGNTLLNSLIYAGKVWYAAWFKVQHDFNVMLKQYFELKACENKNNAQKTEDAYRLTIDYFKYLKLNGLWMLNGSRLMDSQRAEYQTKQSYRLKVTNNENITVTWHEEHNLFFLDGTWSLDGSKILDAFQKTEVM